MTTTDDILRLALAALAGDVSSLAVMGDAIGDLSWFDPRVMQLVYPLGPYPRNGFRTKAERLRRQADRAMFKEGFRLYFQGFVAKPTETFARAVATVLLFGSWRKRPWPLVYEMKRARMRFYSEALVVVNGVELTGPTLGVIDLSHWRARPPAPLFEVATGRALDRVAASLYGIQRRAAVRAIGRFAGVPMETDEELRGRCREARGSLPVGRTSGSYEVTFTSPATPRRRGREA